MANDGFYGTNGEECNAASTTGINIEVSYILDSYRDMHRAIRDEIITVLCVRGSPLASENGGAKEWLRAEMQDDAVHRAETRTRVSMIPKASHFGFLLLLYLLVPTLHCLLGF